MFLNKYGIVANLRRSFFFRSFFELKIRPRLKFEALFFTLRRPLKRNFPLKTSDHAKRVEYFKADEVYLLSIFFFSGKYLFKVWCVFS